MRIRIWMMTATMVALAGPLWAQPTTRPIVGPTTAPTTQNARTMMDVQRDMQAAGMEVQAAMQGVTGPQDLTDPAKRDKLAVQVLPSMRRLIALFDEACVIEPRAKDQLQMAKAQGWGLMSILGDEQATKDLNQLAESKNAQESMLGKTTLIQGQWLQAGTDAAKQGKVVDELEKLAKTNPKDDMLAGMIIGISRQAPAKEAKDRLDKIIASDLNGQLATRYKSQAKEQDEAEGKLKALENKPLTIAGDTIDGKKFTSADWKGKVILVDFWATWCGPCLGELPRVKKIYKDFHDKGLEIVGVSCDRDADALKKFLVKNPEMVWPQLFDPKQQGWHPLATQYGVDGIPTMFLIDKKGVVRTVEARENMEQMIPKLLDEK